MKILKKLLKLERAPMVATTSLSGALVIALLLKLAARRVAPVTPPVALPTGDA